MKRSTTDRLAKLLPMLSSDKDGEVLNAVGMIQRTLKSDGSDLYDLAKAIGGSSTEGWEYVIRARPGRPFNFADATRRAKSIGTDDMHPNASTLRLGLPLTNPDRIASWREVARYCLDLHKRLPPGKRYRFLRPDEKERLKRFASDGHWPTNLVAQWLETVLARCHQARDAAHPGPKPSGAEQ